VLNKDSSHVAPFSGW